MSLDVYLIAKVDTGGAEPHEVSLFEGNVTHNLGILAGEAGIYAALWRPEEIGATHAKDIITPLKVGIALMEGDPARFQKLSPANGWGSYEAFVPWVKEYLQACIKHPLAKIEVSR